MFHIVYFNKVIFDFPEQNDFKQMCSSVFIYNYICVIINSAYNVNIGVYILQKVLSHSEFVFPPWLIWCEQASVALTATGVTNTVTRSPAGIT